MNSRAKGCRIELQAAKYLTALGYKCSRMGRNGYSDCDLKPECPELEHIHLEVKGDRDIGIGTKALTDALAQALDAALQRPTKTGGVRPYAVLWWEHRKGWRLTWLLDMKAQVTVADDAHVAWAIHRLASEAAP